MDKDTLKNKIDISIIVVGYRSQNVLINCLQSIMRQKDCTWELIYVENCIEDSAINLIQQRFPNVLCINSGSNIGFGQGCNLGAKHAFAKYLLFLNPDTALKNRHNLKNMFDYMELHPRVGLAAPLFSNLKDTNKYGNLDQGVSKH